MPILIFPAKLGHKTATIRGLPAACDGGGRPAARHFGGDLAAVVAAVPPAPACPQTEGEQFLCPDRSKTCLAAILRSNSSPAAEEALRKNTSGRKL